MSVDQINNSKLMWKISGGLSALVIFAGAFMYLQTNDDRITTDQTMPLRQTKALEKVEPAPLIVKTSPEAIVENQHALVKESILAQEIPQNASLAKEEIARLEDIQNQLQTQQSMLAEQQKNADKIIQLKEEQLKLLEEQLSVQN